MPKRTKLRNLNKGSRYRIARECKGIHVDPQTAFVGGAHSIGIGRKITAGRPTNQLAIRHYVEKKLPESQLSAEQALPKTYRFYSRSEDRNVSITTDVIESPRPELEVDPKDRLRPAPGGCSIGTPPPPGFANAGTLGGWVWDLEDDSIVMLSNEHVLGTTAGVGIVQPGTLDGGVFPGDRIGEVKRGIPRSTTAVNTVDCAIGDPQSTDIYQAQVIDIGHAVYATEIAALDMKVEKFGRTTERTFGEVTDIDVTTSLSSGHTFTDCIRVDAISPSPDWSAGGDSGSLVFSRMTIEDSEVKPVIGLHFAGASTHGIECKIQNVFSALNLTTLCSGAFAVFLDSLFDAEVTGELTQASELSLEGLGNTAARRPLGMIPPTLIRKDRELLRSTRFFGGISRDLQSRLSTSVRGRQITQLVDHHRGELLDLLISNGDVRRSVVAAFRPLVAGAITTSDVFNRTVTDRDIDNLQKLSVEVMKVVSSTKLKASLKMLQAVGAKAEGKRLGQIFGIKG